MTIKVKAIVGGVCLDRTFDSSAIALAYLAELQLFDFELVPVVSTPDVSDFGRVGFFVIDKNPGLTLEVFTWEMLQICAADEFTTASIRSIFEEAKTLHATFCPSRTNMPLPDLAFALFKENGYDSIAALRALRAERKLSFLEARNAILEAGLVAKD